MSSSGQPQFRYTQTPSKVLHLRNLPWECTDEELVELCKPFGKIVNTKCNVGANHNQAFVEFVRSSTPNDVFLQTFGEDRKLAELNQAISMVSYYASSSEPAQVRGKTVYIQYSNRQEIVNNKASGEVAGNVLLVTIEGVEAGDVSIDVIHLVSPALIQYTDASTASEARNALDGRSIPRLSQFLSVEHIWKKQYILSLRHTLSSPFLLFLLSILAFHELQILASRACYILPLANFLFCTYRFKYQIPVPSEQVSTCSNHTGQFFFSSTH
ncbi:hypothetical protein B296_00051535 [Ensete ventricosum]|uniref:RRM domain-containing protein n=1 Tax=Ensete ventricosum TaxID=4639 RepID=A0A426YGH7_ENSVE|nr:hypothetical protein B296_00051535 [Ensete ventricosum]